eukprot:3629084-Prymnesium_polylepis.1
MYMYGRPDHRVGVEAIWDGFYSRRGLTDACVWSYSCIHEYGTEGAKGAAKVSRQTLRAALRARPGPTRKAAKAAPYRRDTARIRHILTRKSRVGKMQSYIPSRM